MWSKLGFVLVAILLLAFSGHPNPIAKKTQTLVDQTQKQLNYVWQVHLNPTWTKFKYRSQGLLEKTADFAVQQLELHSDRLSEKNSSLDKTHVLIDGEWHLKRSDHRYLIKGEVIYFNEQEPSRLPSFLQNSSGQGIQKSDGPSQTNERPSPPSLLQDLQHLQKTSRDRTRQLNSNLE